MRIHLPLHPAHFAKDAPAGSGPLARIGGDLVVIELQGELEWDGDNTDGVVGVLGLDRPDHPTLHIGEHHLLHGKMSNLPRPYAVIRRAQAPVAAASTSTAHGTPGHTVEGDAADEESDEERERAEAERTTPNRPTKKARVDKGRDDEENEEGETEDGPLFPPADTFTTPKTRTAHLPGSSPLSAFAATPRDYSSDLSSPVTGMDAWGFPGKAQDRSDEVDGDEDGEEEEERRREERRRRRKAQQQQQQQQGTERTRHYEVVAVVRKKVVFALRPEPLVAATQLPE